MKLELIQALGRAAEGQTIGWIGNRHSEITDDFQAADNVCRSSAATIHRTNGAQKITFPNGGRILFLIPQHVRGLSLDRAYVPSGTSEDVLQALMPALQTSNDGMLIPH